MRRLWPETAGLHKPIAAPIAIGRHHAASAYRRSAGNRTFAFTKNVCRVFASPPASANERAERVKLASPAGFEPAVSTLKGSRAGPLHHGDESVGQAILTQTCVNTGLRSLPGAPGLPPRRRAPSVQPASTGRSETLRAASRRDRPTLVKNYTRHASSTDATHP